MMKSADTSEGLPSVNTAERRQKAIIMDPVHIKRGKRHSWESPLFILALVLENRKSVYYSILNKSWFKLNQEIK